MYVSAANRKCTIFSALTLMIMAFYYGKWHVFAIFSSQRSDLQQNEYKISSRIMTNNCSIWTKQIRNKNNHGICENYAHCLIYLLLAVLETVAPRTDTGKTKDQTWDRERNSDSQRDKYRTQTDTRARRDRQRQRAEAVRQISAAKRGPWCTQSDTGHRDE